LNRTGPTAASRVAQLLGHFVRQQVGVRSAALFAAKEGLIASDVSDYQKGRRRIVGAEFAPIRILARHRFKPREPAHQLAEKALDYQAHERLPDARVRAEAEREVAAYTTDSEFVRVIEAIGVVVPTQVPEVHRRAGRNRHTP